MTTQNTYVSIGPDVPSGGTQGQVLAKRSDSDYDVEWEDVAGTGTVTSIALAAPASILAVSGSPITSAGTLNLSLANQVKNTIFAGPISGANAQPTFRTLSLSDVPVTNAHILVGNASNIAADVAVSGDLTLTNTGSLTVNSSAITNAKLASMANNTVKANKSGGSAAPSDLALNDLAEATSSVLTITNGSKSIISSSNLTIQVKQSDTSNPGYLSSTDWNTFNDKQVAGNYITALTGDVTASGPGSSIAILHESVSKRYIDFLNGDDAGTGSIVSPWKTLQHAYDAVLDVSVNKPYVFYLSGGNNDTDAAPITGKPNVSLVSDYLIQVSQPLTISGGSTNDSVAFTNIIFIGAVTWVRNDISVMGVTFTNSEFFSGPVLKQTGSGTLSVTAYNTVTVNAEFQTNGTGSFFYAPNFLGSTTTFHDATSSAYYQFMGGYNSSNIIIAGGAEGYFSGMQIDVPFGAALTCTTTANGTPLIQTDASSIPLAITGTPTINYISQSLYTAYTPSDGTKWANPQPITIKEAVDRIAAVVGLTIPIP